MIILRIISRCIKDRNRSISMNENSHSPKLWNLNFNSKIIQPMKGVEGVATEDLTWRHCSGGSGGDCDWGPHLRILSWREWRGLRLRVRISTWRHCPGGSEGDCDWGPPFSLLSPEDIVLERVEGVATEDLHLVYYHLKTLSWREWRGLRLRLRISSWRSPKKVSGERTEMLFLHRTNGFHIFTFLKKIIWKKYVYKF